MFSFEITEIAFEQCPLRTSISRNQFIYRFNLYIESYGVMELYILLMALEIDHHGYLLLTTLRTQNHCCHAYFCDYTRIWWGLPGLFSEETVPYEWYMNQNWSSDQFIDGVDLTINEWKNSLSTHEMTQLYTSNIVYISPRISNAPR